MNVPNVVEISHCGLYAKTPEALQHLLRHLKEEGYDIKDCSKADQRPSRAEQEKRGYCMWYASLRDDVCDRKGKCGSCGSYIKVNSIKSHKRKCEVCGAYTFIKLARGGHVRFVFLDDDQASMWDDLEFQVYDYDDSTGCLLLYPKPVCGRRWGSCTPERARQVLDRNRSKWHLRKARRLPRGLRRYIRRLKSQGGRAKAEAIHRSFRNRYPAIDLLAVRHNPYSLYIDDKTDINLCDVTGEVHNHTIVKLCKGEEYSEWTNLPVPESYSIYEAWHWAPLQPSPKLHEKIIHAARMVSRCDFYYQDGRAAFYDVHLERMRQFVEHFTVLDIKAWDAMIRKASKSGPGMIKAIAAFCHPLAKAQDNPNIGNWLVAAGKMIKGQPITEEEEVAAMAAELDPEEGGKIRDFLGSFPKE